MNKTNKTLPPLPWFVRFLILFVTIGIGFMLLDHLRPQPPSAGRDWLKVAVAALCGGIGGLIIGVLQWGIARREARAGKHRA